MKQEEYDKLPNYLFAFKKRSYGFAIICEALLLVAIFVTNGNCNWNADDILDLVRILSYLEANIVVKAEWVRRCGMCQWNCFFYQLLGSLALLSYSTEKRLPQLPLV